MKKSKSKYINVILPDDITSGYEYLIGMEKTIEELSDLLSYIKHEDNRYDNIDIKPCSNIILSGPKGCGKSTLVKAFSKESELPMINIFCPYITDLKDIDKVFKELSSIQKKYFGVILYFDNIEYMSTLESEISTYFYSELMQFLEERPNTICFLSCSSTLIASSFILNENGFEKKIKILNPELNIREQLFERFCSKYNPNGINYNYIAKQTSGLTGKTIKLLVKRSVLKAIKSNQKQLTQEILEEEISQYLYGEKRKKTTDEERKLTAYHEAGHAVVGYFAGIKNISKVDIIHREESLGLTISNLDEEKYSWTKYDYEKQILLCFGSLCAENHLLGCTTSGVTQDLEVATAICTCMVCSFGMSDEFGPISLFGIGDNENNSYPFTKLIEISDLIIQKMLKNYLDNAKLILTNHIKELEALVSALLEKEVITSEEMIEIFNNC